MGESDSQTTLQRPYLLRAMHEWMSDNNLTPHIVIDVDAAKTDLPLEYAKDGKLVLNVSYSATQNLVISNDGASFDARFGQASRHLDIPILAILGIYARETGQGMIFSAETTSEDESVSEGGETAEKQSDTGNKHPDRGRPELKIIK